MDQAREVCSFDQQDPTATRIFSYSCCNFFLFMNERLTSRTPRTSDEVLK